MKKKILILTALLGLWLPVIAVASPAAAVNVFGPCTGTSASSSSTCQDVKTSSGNPIISTIAVVINIISIAIGVAAVIMIIIGGMRMVISGGDAEAVKSARQGIIYALVGIAVAVFAQAIVVFILNNIK